MAKGRSGNVYERRPGLWECRVMVAGKSLRTTVRGTEDEAWAEVRRIEGIIGSVPSLGRHATLRAVWDAYSVSRGQRLAAKTLSNYEWHMERYWLPIMGNEMVWSITRKDVQDAMLGNGWSRDTASRCRRILSSVLSWAESEGYVVENPIRRGGFELPDAVEYVPDDADDPFAAIEGKQDVWGAQTVLDALPRMEGLPLEPCWLACVGAGLRVEEALALRKVDVRRVAMGGRMMTQLAVHHARPDTGERKVTKTRRSVRIVTVAEPFGSRLWELVERLPDRDDLLCPVSASNQNRSWRLYFEEPPKGWHKRMSVERRMQGRLHGLPYVPLSRMRATHATLMQQAGVLDSIAAAVQGHSERVAYYNYQRADSTGAAQSVGELLTLVV